MGVPAFFRWLSRKYPSVIIECNENKKVDTETGEVFHEDATLPNPNGIEFDNLYLDMNGIIHPCTHPEDKPAPKNEDEMMVAIFECIDRLFAIVRPRKLLYMAIDGVAPRAKMNQQRSRRFRAAKESAEKQSQIEKIRSDLLARGFKLPPEKEKGEHFDSNCITPGTPFMDRLSKTLHYYIHDRMNSNPAWRNICVILSDANVPGEGEHKIMDFIRKQRAQPDHDPNTQHVLCGADADLIMLGLATHEPNFTIIREEFLPNKPRPCDVCQQFGHEMDKCTGIATSETTPGGYQPDIPVATEVKFIFVRLSVLREYLRRTLDMQNLPFEYDFERAIDDWVFMCFFVGNDFLPHLPSLEIREGALDRLVELYKKCVYRTGGFLTDSGDVNMDRVQMILADLGDVEDKIFKDRQRREVQFREREKQRKRQRTEDYNGSNFIQSTFGPTAVGPNAAPLPLLVNYKQNAAQLRMGNEQPRGTKRTSQELTPETEEEEEKICDEVRLWEDGFKERYYESKFDVKPENYTFRNSVAAEYVQGLCWVLKYYYQGCASWNWYFPYHYAPFASDFRNLRDLTVLFPRDTKPFNPLEQLMGVFPAASRSHIPEPWGHLMTSPDSPIIDFYPEDFKIDLNGKKFAWQGVALLPFVDENRLFKALARHYDELTDEEIRRNTRGDNRLYFRYNSPAASYCDQLETDMTEITVCIKGMSGIVLRSKECVEKNGRLRSPIAGLPDVVGNQTVTLLYKDPRYDVDFIFPAKRLENAEDPPCVLKPENTVGAYKPVIGFNPDGPRAYLGHVGHRIVNAHVPRQNDFQQQQQQQHQGGYQQYNRGGYHNHNQGNNRSNQGYDRGNQRYNQGNNQYNRGGNHSQGNNSRFGGNSYNFQPFNGAAFQPRGHGSQQSYRGARNNRNF